LPLISDSEMDDLFGQEVADTLAALARRDQHERICLRCPSKCCWLVACEFFIPSLNQCAIHNFRPVLCRMHFCNKFGEQEKKVIVEIGDIFLDALLAGVGGDKNKADLLDSPPFGRIAPALTSVISPIIEAIKERKTSEQAGMTAINCEAAKYRIS
jgi:Fe-S-cluster containining protein